MTPPRVVEVTPRPRTDRLAAAVAQWACAACEWQPDHAAPQRDPWAPILAPTGRMPWPHCVTSRYCAVRALREAIRRDAARLARAGRQG